MDALVVLLAFVWGIDGKTLPVEKRWPVTSDAEIISATESCYIAREELVDSAILNGASFVGECYVLWRDGEDA